MKVTTPVGSAASRWVEQWLRVTVVSVGQGDGRGGGEAGGQGDRAVHDGRVVGPAVIVLESHAVEEGDHQQVEIAVG
jgi:hypothetical protein